MEIKKSLSVLLTAMLVSTINVYAQEDILSELDGLILQGPPMIEYIKPSKETYQKAVQSMNDKNFEYAIKYLDAYIEGKPTKYEAYKLRGESYAALHRFDLAEEDFKKAIEIKTNDDKFVTGTKVISAVVLGADKQEQYANAELGILYGELMYAQMAQNNQEYLESYKKAMEYNSHQYLPKPKRTDVTKINCPQKYGKQVEPQGADKHIQDVVTAIENGNYEDAIYKISNIISTYPDYYYGYYLTGVALYLQNMDDDAVDAFKSAIRLNPYDFESYASLGQLYYYKAEKTHSAEYAKKSIQNFAKALKLQPNNNYYNYYMGLNNLVLNDYVAAIKNFDAALKIKPDDYNSLYYKAIAQYVDGNYDAVIDVTSRLLSRHVSNYNSVLYLRASAYNKLGKFTEAQYDIDKIQASIEDIYNDDVKILSEKEKTLSSYVAYLRSQILTNLGESGDQDYSIAIKNPIIFTLSERDVVVAPYVKKLNTKQITQSEFEKAKELYNSELVSINFSHFKVPAPDIDAQYDYIRTAFADLGLGLSYQQDGMYKFVLQDNYLNKKYSNIVVTEEPVELVLGDDEFSLAKMLANGTFFNTVSSLNKFDNNKNYTASEQPALKPINEAQENAQQTENGAAQDTAVAKVQEEVTDHSTETKTAFDEEIAKNVENYVISYDDNNQPIAAETSQNNIVEVQTEERGHENYTITYAPSPSTPQHETITLPKVEELQNAQAKFEDIEEQSVETVIEVSDNVQLVDETLTNAVEEVQNAVQEVNEAVQEVQNVAENPMQNLGTKFAQYTNSHKSYFNTEQETAQEQIMQQVEDAKTVTPSIIANFRNDAETVVDNAKQTVEKVRVVNGITEKRTDIDINEFNVQPKEPVIKASDEVVEFEPKKFLASQQTSQEKVQQQVENTESFAQKISQKAEKVYEDTIKVVDVNAPNVVVKEQTVTEKLQEVLTPKVQDVTEEVVIKVTEEEKIATANNINSLEQMIKSEKIAQKVAEEERKARELAVIEQAKAEKLAQELKLKAEAEERKTREQAEKERVEAEKAAQQIKAKEEAAARKAQELAQKEQQKAQMLAEKQDAKAEKIAEQQKAKEVAAVRKAQELSQKEQAKAVKAAEQQKAKEEAAVRKAQELAKKEQAKAVKAAEQQKAKEEAAVRKAQELAKKEQAKAVKAAEQQKAKEVAAVRKAQELAQKEQQKAQMLAQKERAKAEKTAQQIKVREEAAELKARQLAEKTKAKEQAAEIKAAEKLKKEQADAEDYIIEKKSVIKSLTNTSNENNVITTKKPKSKKVNVNFFDTKLKTIDNIMQEFDVAD